MNAFTFFMIFSGIVALLIVAVKLFNKPTKKEIWELHFVDGRVEGGYKSERAAEEALCEMGCKPFTATAVRRDNK
ncbi:MAG: hypothetical protein WC238_01020 [Parcubacteria group bacterium]|jgi:hypothetical protein